MTMEITMSGPDITEVEIKAIEAVLRTSHLSIGPRITKFEEQFAAYIGARYAAAVNSGTSGLHLVVIAAGVQEGDLVITTPFSFIASANCILYERALPVFVDVDPATGNIDPDLIVEAIEALTNERRFPPSSRHSSFAVRRPKAILPIHAFGQPADMDPILEVARRYNLAVIEDACEAIGAEYKGRKAGTLGDAAVFAFYPNKQITTGEGGMIVTDDEEWANLFRSLRNQGRDTFNAWLSHARLGYNYRLDEMSAALGLAQMRRIEELLSKRVSLDVKEEPFWEAVDALSAAAEMKFFGLKAGDLLLSTEESRFQKIEPAGDPIVVGAFQVFPGIQTFIPPESV